MAAAVKVDEETGFRSGSLSNTIAKELLKGGKSRNDINERLRKKFASKETRNGTEINIPVSVSNTIKALQKRGFVVKSSYQLVPKPKRSSGKHKTKAAAAAA